MKFIKFVPILFVLTLFNTGTYAENCDEIKMDSSVNIIKKIKCKAANRGTEKQEVANTETATAEEPKKKKGILGKIFQKPKWMK